MSAVQRYPSLGKYIRVAEANGCKVEFGHNGKNTFVQIHKPDGSDFVIVPDADQGQLLPPDMVSYLDRRLGISTPFGKDP